MKELFLVFLALLLFTAGYFVAALLANNTTQPDLEQYQVCETQCFAMESAWGIENSPAGWRVLRTTPCTCGVVVE